jgi:hypothetical protein
MEYSRNPKVYFSTKCDQKKLQNFPRVAKKSFRPAENPSLPPFQIVIICKRKNSIREHPLSKVFISKRKFIREGVDCMKTITIRITAGDLEFLKKEAQKLRISLSAIIRMKLAETIGLETQAV